MNYKGSKKLLTPHSKIVSVILPTKITPNQSLIHELEALHAEVLIQKEPGITNAVWHGIQKAHGQFIAIMDSDGSHKASDLKKMIATIGSHDLAVGVRVIPGKPLARKIISLTFNAFAHLILGIKTHDPMSAFFLGKREAMKFRNTRSCKFGLELQMKAQSIIEVPIQPYARNRSYIKPVEGVFLLMRMVELRSENP